MVGRTDYGASYYVTLPSQKRLGFSWMRLVRPGNSTVRRMRVPFGGSLLWVPRLDLSHRYLTIMYGSDWNRTMRGLCRPRANAHFPTCLDKHIVELPPGQGFESLVGRPFGPAHDELASVPFSAQRGARQERRSRRAGRSEIAGLSWTKDYVL